MQGGGRRAPQLHSSLYPTRLPAPGGPVSLTRAPGHSDPLQGCGSLNPAPSKHRRSASASPPCLPGVPVPTRKGAGCRAPPRPRHGAPRLQTASEQLAACGRSRSRERVGGEGPAAGRLGFGHRGRARAAGASPLTQKSRRAGGGTGPSRGLPSASLCSRPLLAGLCPTVTEEGAASPSPRLTGGSE